MYQTAMFSRQLYRIQWVFRKRVRQGFKIRINIAMSSVFLLAAAK
jgi:hypothetical protein